MSYDYTVERTALFSEDGVRLLIKVRDRVREHLQQSGAFRLEEAGLSAWHEIACIDYLVELGELVEFKRDCWGQYRVFTSPQVHNR